MTTASALPESLSAAARSYAAGPHRLLIGGERLDAADGRTFETRDPSTGRIIAEVAQAGAADVDRAVGAAREAFEDGRWSGIAAAERTRAMLAFAERSRTHADELAELESLDNGKPVKLARRVDVPLAAEHLRYYAGWPTKIAGETIPVPRPNMHCYTRKEPVGVCAQIIPWNFPLLMAAWKIGPALAAGCTIVLKPAEQTPLTALRLGELALEAGLPEGVINVVTGDGETGAALVEHPGRRQDRLHRLDGRRARDRRQGGRSAQAGHARAGRQVAQHHLRRRRPRRRGQGRLPGDLLQHRPGLQRRLAAVRADATSTTTWLAAWSRRPQGAPRPGPRAAARSWAR